MMIDGSRRWMRVDGFFTVVGLTTFSDNPDILYIPVTSLKVIAWGVRLPACALFSNDMPAYKT